jgi:beta-N-acetylhexosaminidase
VPFRAAVEAGARLVMVGHYALPAFTWSHDLPSSLSAEVVDGLLRKSLGFEGVVITDALNMHAVTQGSGMVVDVIAALGAGVDLLLCADGEEQQEVLRSGLDLARRRRLIDPGGLETSADRVLALREWLAGFGRPAVEVVGSAEHHALADEVARRAITLVRDQERLLPLRPAADDTILTVMPRLIDLTPADTSSIVPPLLAASLAEHHPRVIEMVTSHSPLPSEVHDLRPHGSGTGATRRDFDRHRHPHGDGGPAHPLGSRLLPGGGHSPVHVRHPAAGDEGAGRSPLREPANPGPSPGAH